MPPTTLTVDSKDLGTLGLVLDLPLGWRDSAPRAHRHIQIPKRRGFLKATSTPVWEPRRLTLSGHVEGATLAALRSNHREVVHRLSDGLLTCSFADASTEVFFAYMDEEGVTVRPVGGAFESNRHAVTFNLIAPDPRIYENSTTTVSATSTAAQSCPLGTAEVEPVITVSGANTFDVIYKTSTGGVVATFGISGATGAPHTIDMLAQTILNTSGDSQIAAKTTGTDFFVLDPFDGDWPSSSYPTVQVSAGTFSMTYQRAYL